MLEFNSSEASIDDFKTGSLLLARQNNFKSRIIRTFTTSTFNHWSIILRSDLSRDELKKNGVEGHLNMYGKYVYTLDVGDGNRNSHKNILTKGYLFLCPYEETSGCYTQICFRKIKKIKLSDEEFLARIYAFIKKYETVEFTAFFTVLYFFGLQIDYEKYGYNCIAIVSRFMAEVCSLRMLPINITPTDLDREDPEGIRTLECKMIDTIYEEEITCLSRKYDDFFDSIGLSFSIFLIWLLFVFMTFSFS